jgi:hypothetical protein
VVGLKPINLTYNEVASTTDNRSWIVSQGEIADSASYTITIDHTGTNNFTTTTLMPTNNYIRAGDYVRLTHSASPEYTVQVNTRVGNVITHSSIARTVTAGDTCYRPFISKLVIINEDNLPAYLEYGVHYTLTDYSSPTVTGKGFTLVNNFEALIAGFPAIFDPKLHKIYVDVYGEPLITDYAIAATPSAVLPSLGGALSHPVGIIYQLLSEIDSIDLEADIDETSFINATSDIDSGLGAEMQVGFSIPLTVDGEWPKYSDLISNILVSSLTGFGQKSGKMQLEYFKSVSADTPDYTLKSDQISDVNISIEESDIYSDFETKTNANIDVPDIYNAGYAPFVSYTRTYSNVSTLALHHVKEKYAKDTLITQREHGDLYVTALGLILSNPRLRYSFNTFGYLWNASIGDVVQIERENVVGVDFIEGTNQTVKGRIVAISKATSGITATIEIY